MLQSDHVVSLCLEKAARRVALGSYDFQIYHSIKHLVTHELIVYRNGFLANFWILQFLGAKISRIFPAEVIQVEIYCI